MLRVDELKALRPPTPTPPSQTPTDKTFTFSDTDKNCYRTIKQSLLSRSYTLHPAFGRTNTTTMNFTIKPSPHSTNHIPNFTKYLATKSALASLAFPRGGETYNISSLHTSPLPPPPTPTPAQDNFHPTHHSSLLQTFHPPTFDLSTSQGLSNFISAFRANAARSFFSIYTQSPQLFIDYAAEVDLARRSVEFQLVPSVDMEFRSGDSLAESDHGLTSREWDRLLSCNYSIYEERVLIYNHNLDSHPHHLHHSNSDFQLSNALSHKINPKFPSPLYSTNTNLWIVKAPSSSNGKGIEVHYRLEDILERERGMGGRVAQKYVEAISTITKNNHRCSSSKFKFDLRQWVLVVRDGENDYRCYSYDPCYLRLCSKEFNLEKCSLKDEGRHLANFSVNSGSSSSSSSSLLWSQQGYIRYLTKTGLSGQSIWENKIAPSISQVIISAISAASLLAITSTSAAAPTEGHRNPNQFELLGFDFVLDDDHNPWLLEVNETPGLSHRGVVRDEGNIPYNVDKQIQTMSDGLVSLTVDVWDGSNPHQEVPPNWHFVEIQAFDKEFQNALLPASHPASLPQLSVTGHTIKSTSLVKLEKLLDQKLANFTLDRFFRSYCRTYFLPRRQSTLSIQKFWRRATFRTAGRRLLNKLNQQRAGLVVVHFLRRKVLKTKFTKVQTGLAALVVVSKAARCRQKFLTWKYEWRKASQLASLTSKLPTWFLNLALQQWKSVNHATNTIRNSIRKFILAKKYQAKCSKIVGKFLSQFCKRWYTKRATLATVIQQSYHNHLALKEKLYRQRVEKNRATKVIRKLMIQFYHVLSERKQVQLGLWMKREEEARRRNEREAFLKVEMEKRKVAKFRAEEKLMREVEENRKRDELDRVKLKSVKGAEGRKLVGAARRQIEALMDLEREMGLGDGDGDEDGEKSKLKNKLDLIYNAKANATANANAGDVENNNMQESIPPKKKKKKIRRGGGRKKSKVSDFQNVLSVLDNKFS